MKPRVTSIHDANVRHPAHLRDLFILINEPSAARRHRQQRCRQLARQPRPGRPLSCRSEKLYSCEAKVSVAGQVSKAMADQITTVAKERLSERTGLVEDQASDWSDSQTINPVWDCPCATNAARDSQSGCTTSTRLPAFRRLNLSGNPVAFEALRRRNGRGTHVAGCHQRPERIDSSQSRIACLETASLPTLRVNGLIAESKNSSSGRQVGMAYK